MKKSNEYFINITSFILCTILLLFFLDSYFGDYIRVRNMPQINNYMYINNSKLINSQETSLLNECINELDEDIFKIYTNNNFVFCLTTEKEIKKINCAGLFSHLDKTIYIRSAYVYNKKTCSEILTHEIGHFIDYITNYKISKNKYVIADYNNQLANYNINSYYSYYSLSNIDEFVAESYLIYITNPQLLPTNTRSVLENQIKKIKGDFN